jgi:hypothetical protein
MIDFEPPIVKSVENFLEDDDEIKLITQSRRNSKRPFLQELSFTKAE